MNDISYERRLVIGIKYAKRFTGDRIDYNELLSIIEIARWAPSIGNIQSWEVIIVEDPIEIKKLARLHPLGYIYEKAGGLFFIVVDPEQSPHYLIDSGSLIAYIALASSIKGYSVLIIDLRDNPVFKTELNIPPLKYLAALVAVGKEASSTTPSILPRKPLEHIVYRNKYGLR
uniref:Nitroreductase domain-containing protein n=1 Tax=Staphylothermus marinus TaxID=2280 RepID=A0A7C4DA52_STAMA